MLVTIREAAKMNYEVRRQLEWMMNGLTEKDFLCSCGNDYVVDYDLGRSCMACEVGIDWNELIQAELEAEAASIKGQCQMCGELLHKDADILDDMCNECLSDVVKAI